MYFFIIIIIIMKVLCSLALNTHKDEVGSQEEWGIDEYWLGISVKKCLNQ